MPTNCLRPPKSFFFSWSVLLGLNDLDSGDGGTEAKIWKLYVHPMFEQINGASYYDVAVLGWTPFFHSGHISLKVPNVEFDFDVCDDSIQFLTHTSNLQR